MQSQRGSIRIELVAIIVIAVAALVYVVAEKNASKQEGRACTEEAKICPDGSAVGRTGPNCEFAACPNQTTDRKTYRNENFGFEIQLTSAWEGYRVKLIEMSSNFGSGSLIFQVPANKTPDNPDGYVEVMQIQVLNPEYWEKISKDALKPTFLGQNNSGVFVVSVANDYGVFLPNINLEVDKVISTFRFTSDETAGWKTYKNEEYGFEIKSPDGVGESGKNAYIIKTFAVSGIFDIDVFTDESVDEWSADIERAIENNEPIGDPAMLPYPLSVKHLLTTKPVGYDCTVDFGEYLNKSRNESCEIVDVNGSRAFKIIATGPFQSEVSELKYIFFNEEIWFDASQRFWIYDEKDPNKQLYTFEQLNSILQGKTSNPEIKAEVDLFMQILSTFRFTK